MLKRSLRLLLVSLSLFALSCSSVPNVMGCAEISISKGVCKFTLTNETIMIDDDHPFESETWFDIRAKALTIPAKSWAKLKAWAVKMCKQNKCDIDISTWDRDIAK